MVRSRSPREVAAAWIATGPLGHLVAGIADWVEVISRHVRERARGS